MTFGRNIPNTPEQSLHVSVFVQVTFKINFSSSKTDTENNANIDTVLSKHANFDEVQFFKHKLKLIIFRIHNLQTFKHNSLINKLLLISFTYLTFVLNCITGIDENTRHTVPNFLNQQPLYRNSVITQLPSILTFTFVQIFDANFVIFAERRHVDNQCYA